MYEPLTIRTLNRAAKKLAASDPDLRSVHEHYGAPPLWSREPGFATLLHIILEQQVSLASAKACFDKLNAHLGHLTPARLLTLDDATIRRIGFSRQKASYARHLCDAIISKHIDLDSLHQLNDVEVKTELTKLKGVGEWTSDIYLLMALLRPDVMPRGDIALHEAYRKLKGLSKRPSSDEFVLLAKQWSPYRSVAARLLWHYYLNERVKK